MSNNIYHNYPAIMNDGRFITMYNSSNDFTNKIGKINGICNSNRLRNFLQTNAKQIMKNENKYFYNEYSCHPNIACSEGYYCINYGKYPLECNKYNKCNKSTC